MQTSEQHSTDELCSSLYSSSIHVPIGLSSQFIVGRLEIPLFLTALCVASFHHHF